MARKVYVILIAVTTFALFFGAVTCSKYWRGSVEAKQKEKFVCIKIKESGTVEIRNQDGKPLTKVVIEDLGFEEQLDLQGFHAKVLGSAIWFTGSPTCVMVNGELRCNW